MRGAGAGRGGLPVWWQRRRGCGGVDLSHHIRTCVLHAVRVRTAVSLVLITRAKAAIATVSSYPKVEFRRRGAGRPSPPTLVSEETAAV